MAAFSASAMNELAQLFKRQANCVPCPGTAPTCQTHVCETGLTCVLSVQSCEACAKVECQKLVTKAQTTAAASVANNSDSKEAPVGAIVGGVFAFVVIVFIAAFFIIRRNKKKQKEAYEASVATWAVEKESNSSFGGLRDARASTHSVGSIASTVLTRASNVIQIAYIPGVTNRSNPNSPSFLGVPPVPAIPGQHLSPAASEEHFFSANDIARQSVWSTNSAFTVGTADPRASVATTIYRSNAIVSPVAATATVVRARPAVVTVKNSPAVSSSASSPGTPPVPAIDLQKFPTQKIGDGMLTPRMASERPPQSPAFSVGSTFLNKMAMSTVDEERHDSRRSMATPNTGVDEQSPFSDRASIMTDTVAPLRIKNQDRASPARHMEGDIRMSFRPISEFQSDEDPSPSRGKSPFGDENRVGV